MPESSYSPLAIQDPSGGYSGHQVQTSRQQSTALRGFYEYGDPSHMKRHSPKLQGKAQHMVGKGCLAYLAYVRDTTAETPTIDSVSVVREFADVLPTYLPGMPPDRDIDFYIELAPDTQPISIPSVFRAYIDSFVIVFIDDILIYSRSSHEQHLRVVLQTLQEQKLYAKFCKCEFYLDSVAFLGNVVSSEGIKVDRKKIETVQSWPHPTSAIEIRSFLGYQSNIEMAPFEALYGRRCRSPSGWFEPGEARLYGTDLVKDTLEKVKLNQERHRAAQSKQKSYADQKARDVSFMVGEKVLLKVSPMKGIMRFGKKEKQSHRFIGPFEVLRRVGEVAYELSLPPSLSGVNPIFHVSMLRRYHADLSYVQDFNTIQLDESLGYEEEPIAIVDREDR
ncbi:uncharacterized protein [Nicotiana tomentosiformis]|uniref:uncharacterized protein n=1 Tax=Nicotiana tomentosiformis TaxID=4098 RepID=UPI00388CC881